MSFPASDTVIELGSSEYVVERLSMPELRLSLRFRPPTWRTFMPARTPQVDLLTAVLPSLRFEVSEAAQILRMSRAQLYNRIHDGSLKPQKDGARTYITRTELERYVQACGH
jgi:excisionase family DNA binding protein